MLTFLQNAANTAHARRYHAKQRIANDFVNDARLDGLTLSRSAGSVYYFNSSGVLTSTGDNVAAFTSNGLFIEGQATNLIAAANYRNFSTWTLTGVTMKSTTPTGIDGTTLTSANNEILENGLLSEHSGTIGWTAATAAKQSVMIAVKRGTGTRHAQLRVGNATDGIYGSVTYNLDTLATIGTVTAEYTTAYVKGAYTIIELVDSNTTTGAQTLYVNIHNGTSNSYTGDGTSTLILDWAQVVRNTSGRPQSHIQGDATRYTSFVSLPWIGAVNNFWVYVDLQHKLNYQFIGDTACYVFSLYKDASNYFRLRLQSLGIGDIYADLASAGSSQSAQLVSVNYTRGTRLRALVTYDSENGLRIRANNNNTLFSASVATFKTSITGFSNGAILYLGSLGDTNISRVPPLEVSAYRVGAGILSAAQMAEMVGI